MTTEYSIQKMVSDGTLSTITLGIQYLQRNDIYMRIAGEETPQSGAPSGYTWYFVDNTTLKILPVVPNGVEVVVYRRTDVDAMYNVYSQNAQFDEATIDENNQQLLYIAQEYLEQGIPGAGVESVEFLRHEGTLAYYRIKRTDGSYTPEFVIERYIGGGFRIAPFTFTTGGTLAVGDSDMIVLWSTAGGGDGQYYLWKGVYPKVIPAASTPASTGGVSDDGWMPWGDITLRAELKNIVPVFKSVAEMSASTTLQVGDMCRTQGYYAPGDSGHCDYQIVAGAGGDGFFTHNVGSNTAVPVYTDTVNVRWFGAKGNTIRSNSGGDDNLVIVSGDDDTPYLKKAFAFVSRDFGPALADKWPDLLQAQTAPTLVFSTNSPKNSYIGFQITDTIPVGAKIDVDFCGCYIMGNHDDFCFGLKESDPGNSVQGFIFSFKNMLFEGPKCAKLNTRWSPGDFNNWGGKLTEFDNCSIKSQVAMVVDAQSNTVLINKCSSIIGLVDVVSDNFVIESSYFNIKPPFSTAIPEMIKFRGSKMYMHDSISIPFYSQTDGVERAHIGIYDFHQAGHQVTSFLEVSGTNFGGEGDGYSCVNVRTKFASPLLAYMSGVSFDNCSLNSNKVPPVRLFKMPTRVNVTNCRGFVDHGYVVDRAISFSDSEVVELLQTPQLPSLFSFESSGNTFTYNAASGFYQGFCHPYFRLLFAMVRSLSESNGRSVTLYDAAVDSGQYFPMGFVRAGASNEIRIPVQFFKLSSAITQDGKPALSRIFGFDFVWYTPSDVSSTDAAALSLVRRRYRFASGYASPNLTLTPTYIDGPTTGRGAFSSAALVSKTGVSYPLTAIPKTVDPAYISVTLVSPDAVSVFDNSLFILENIDEGRLNIL